MKGTRCRRQGKHVQEVATRGSTSTAPRAFHCQLHAPDITRSVAPHSRSTQLSGFLTPSEASELGALGTYAIWENDTRSVPSGDSWCNAVTAHGTRCRNRGTLKRRTSSDGSTPATLPEWRCWLHAPNDDLPDETALPNDSPRASSAAVSPVLPAQEARSRAWLRPENQPVSQAQSYGEPVANPSSPSDRLGLADVPNAKPKVEHRDWIPDYLQLETQRELRELMDEPITNSNEKAYIYALELQEPGFHQNEPQDFVIQVGRSLHANQQIATWRNHFKSKKLLVRGWWSGAIEQGSSGDSMGKTSGEIKNILQAKPRGRYSHRVQKLVLLELADVACHSTHLTPAFLSKFSARESCDKIVSEPENLPLGSPTMDHCPDCDGRHDEIFRLRRFTSEEMIGKEWECIVMPIIEKWGRFVAEHF